MCFLTFARPPDDIDDTPSRHAVPRLASRARLFPSLRSLPKLHWSRRVGGCSQSPK